jgi:hypothetical protein
MVRGIVSVNAWLSGRTLLLWTVAAWLLILVLALRWGPVKPPHHAPPQNDPGI